MPRWIFSLLQFFPLSLFAACAFWNGAPDEARWERAFEIASIAALMQLAVLLPQPRPVNRLVLAANLYVMLGGFAFLTHQWWYLRYYDSLRESAIFIVMLVVGVVTTFATRPGFVASTDMPRPAVLRASAWLLAATAAGLAISILFRGDRIWAAVIPILLLAVLQRVLTRSAPVAGSAAPPDAADGTRQ